MADNINNIQIPTDLTDLVKVEVRGEALRRFLVQLQNVVNTQAKSITALEKRVKALENGTGNSTTT